MQLIVEGGGRQDEDVAFGPPDNDAVACVVFEPKMVAGIAAKMAKRAVMEPRSITARRAR